MRHIKLFEEFGDSSLENVEDTQEDFDSYEMEDEFADEDFDSEEDEFAEKFEAKKSKPDFSDIDKDGNKKETFKKAAKDAKADKKDKKGGKGLSAAQKKLPAGLQAAIARKAAKGKAKD